MEGKGPGRWNGHCFKPILGVTCYLFLGTLCKNALVAFVQFFFNPLHFNISCSLSQHWDVFLFVCFFVLISSVTPFVFLLFIFFLRRLEEFYVGADADVWKVVMLGGKKE